MDKTDRLRDYGLAFLLYKQGLSVCGYELIRELFIFIKLILNSYLKTILYKIHYSFYMVFEDTKVYNLSVYFLFEDNPPTKFGNEFA